MKLNKFGKLYISHAKNMTSGEISVITFISQVCSGNLKKYEENPSIPPKFNRIPTAKFMKRCGMSRSEVFDAVSRLIKKGLIHKKKIKGKAFYFPADDYHGKYYGMVQEEHMIELTKNEKLVYGYLSACQGNNENCNPKISTIAHFVGKSSQIVSKTITSLVRKDVIKRVVNPQKSSTYFVKRFDKNTDKNLVVDNGESPENVLGQSPENLPGKWVESPENVHHYSNNLLKEDNNYVFNNPSRGEKLTGFFEKEKIQKDNIEILENFKNKKKENITVLESFSNPAHTSFRKESVHKYRIMLMTYISNLSPEVIDKMQDNGCNLNDFINMNVSEFLKNGIENEIPIKPESIKKISENDKKYLQDYIDKRKLDSGDSFLDDVKSFSRYMFTIGEHSQQKLRRIIKKIYDDNNQSSIVFDFESKSKVDGDSNGKKLW